MKPHICTPDNDGHCHWCGLIVNTDYHEASGCQCKSPISKYLSEIGRKGGQKSRRSLDPETARKMVAAREAKRLGKVKL